MASNNSGTSTDMMPAPTFSYAQAARAAAVAAPATTATSSAASDIPTARPGQTANASDAPSTTSTTESKVDVSDSILGDSASQLDGRTDPSDKQAGETFSVATSSAARSSAPPSVADSGRIEDDSATDRSTQRSERLGRSSSVAARSLEDADGKKARRGKKGKTDKDLKDPKDSDGAAVDQAQEKEPEPVKVELFEAPIPAVNVWHKRQEAHAAKKQVTPTGIKTATTTGAESSTTSEAWSKSQELKKKARGQDESDVPGPSQNGNFVNGAKGDRKGPDGSRENDQGPRRTGPRGARDSTSTMATFPSVGDRSQWPTPNTSAVEDRRTSLDKLEGLEKDGQDAGLGSKKKKWEKVEITPTYKFETPLSSSRGRGARASRGGRDAASRGGQVAGPVGGSEKSGGANSADSGQPRANGSEGKDRKDGPLPTRAMSLPSSGKLPQGDGTSHRDQRKPSAPAVSSSERSRDSSFTAGQDHASGNRERSEGRADRGGRGGARGRGGHLPGHIQTSQQQQPWLGSNGSFQYRQAQASFSPARNPPFGAQYPNPVKTTGRGANRGQAQSYNLPPRLPGVNGNNRPVSVPNAYGYDFPMSPASAIPYSLPQSMYDPVLLNTLMSQIDYYFSEQNLPRDQWLRRQMDSQGFVPLGVICSFRRMQQITQDHLAVRIACMESTALDFVVGEDNVERLRRRSDWQRWIMPLEERDQYARSDGPGRMYYLSRHAHVHYPQEHLPAYPTMHPAYPLPNGVVPEYQSFSPEGQMDHQLNGHVNGNGYIPETQLSASVPEFSPRQPMEGFSGVNPTANASLKTNLGHVEDGRNGNDERAQAESSTHGSQVNGTNSFVAQTNGVHDDGASARANQEAFAA